MSDLHQTGIISTLHRFHTSSLEQLEKELEKLSKVRPITLVLPALHSELQGEALKRIVMELEQAKYLRQIVVTLGRADGEEFKHTREFFSMLPQKVVIIWNTGEQIAKLYQLLEKHNLNIGPDGKGRAVWMALGYVLAEGKSYMVALHDCDILNYDRGILARLCYPIANPNLDYEFCKGYYSRVSDRIYGRVTRLFITPLIHAMEKIIGYNSLLVYLDSYRYPLAGEFSMTTELSRINRIQGDWGLDFGVLAEVFRNCSVKRVCQVDLIDSYDHKHQSLSEDNPESGLFKMSIDIARVFYRTLASEGVVFSDGLIKTLLATYLRTAQDTIKKYHDDATINNLPFDRHRESLAVKTFAEGLRLGGNSFLEDPLGHPEIPNWNRVTSAIPEFLRMLKQTVEEDNY
jgi:glucosyl-3-phosphoglycerate synthase